MELTERIIDFAKKSEAPFILLDLESVEKNYNRLKSSIKRSEIFYAVKANSTKRIVERLVKLGSSFDVASVGELDLVLELGADISKVSFGNTIKKVKDIKYAYEKGVKIFVADEFVEIDKIAANAPGVKLFVRIEMSDSDSDWPLTKKFGTNVDKAAELLRYAKKMGLEPFGVSFHVGSQCYDKYVWKSALLNVKDIFEHLKKDGINLKFINTGGGMPVKHLRDIPTVEEISQVINETVDEYFEDYEGLIVAAEPGRSMVGNAGILCSKVILRSEKEKNDWIYIDAGVFHGLMETIQGFRYEVIVHGKEGKKQLFTLSGPTCDSVDTIYDEIYLPEDTTMDDIVIFINAGAYTTGYLTTFNGILPPKVYFTDEI